MFEVYTSIKLFLEYYYDYHIFSSYTYINVCANNKFGNYIIYLGSFIGLFIFFTSYDKFKYYKKWYAMGYILFLFIVIFLANTTNLFYFFVAYEYLFFPSFLLVYYIAPNRRGVFASHYFFLWTQGGSFLVLLAFIYLYAKYNIFFFNDLSHSILSNFEQYFILFLIFLGFGIKFPIWPFHYWLTKTHVEAPTFFSIYLSGFLVKTALYGFFLIFSFSKPSNLITFCMPILFWGIIDSTLKMWGQTDLKKLVAFATIQEMNIIGILLIMGGNYALDVCIIFCLVHTILSSIFFYLVELIYRRYRTRNTKSLGGVFLSSPSLAIHIILSVVLYLGLPFTIKFFVELSFLFTTARISLFFCILMLLILNFFGGFVWLKQWFNVLYNNPTKLTNKVKTLQLSDHIFLASLYIYLLFGWILI